MTHGTLIFGRRPRTNSAVDGLCRKPGPDEHAVLALEETEGARQGGRSDRLLGRFRQRLGHQLGHAPGDRRQNPGGRGHGDEAGPHTQPGPAGQDAAAPDLPSDPAKTRRWP